MVPQMQADQKPEKVAFYVKGKPQGADIIELVLDIRRVFIGYPPWKRGGIWDRYDVRRSILDVSDPAWTKGDLDPASVDARYSKQISTNRHLVARIGTGSIVAVPRPGRGLCYLGRVSGPFELVSDPSWADAYLGIRRKQGLETMRESSHVGDIVQGWHVDEWRKIPFPLIPRWITYRLLSRNTMGIINDQPDGRKSAIEVLESLYDGRHDIRLTPTGDEAETIARLLAHVSPNAFEHLVCQLLQLENPEDRWFHIGGSGDDGCDGLGMDGQGNVIGLLQCKWKLDPAVDPYGLGETKAEALREQWGSSVRVYVASLWHEDLPSTEKDGVTFLGSRDIARLLLKHAARCPMATTLSVGIAGTPRP